MGETVEQVSGGTVAGTGGMLGESEGMTGVGVEGMGVGAEGTHSVGAGEMGGAEGTCPM